MGRLRSLSFFNAPSDTCALGSMSYSCLDKCSYPAPYLHFWSQQQQLCMIYFKALTVPNRDTVSYPGLLKQASFTALPLSQLFSDWLLLESRRFKQCVCVCVLFVCGPTILKISSRTERRKNFWTWAFTAAWRLLAHGKYFYIHQLHHFEHWAIINTQHWNGI